MPDRPLADLEAMIGTERRTVTGLTVEAGKVAEFARAIGTDTDVFHESPDAAQPAPLGFTRVSYFPRYRPPGVGPWFGFDLGFRPEYVLHGEQAYRYERPVVVGDTLSATTRLADVFQRESDQGPPMTFCVFHTEYTDAEDDLVVTSRTTRIERVIDGMEQNGPDRSDGQNVDTGGAIGHSHSTDNPDSVPTGPDGSTPDRTRETEPLTRADFVRYAGASGDFNRIHYDEPYARCHGHPQVFGQGMLTAGHAGSLLTDWVAPRAVTGFRTRFEARVWPGDSLTICGAVGKSETTSSERDIDIWVTNQRGETVLTGEATAARTDD